MTDGDHKGKVQVLRDGKWVEGRAAPEQKRADLAALPSAVVTKDPSDENKVHELDPEHTKNTIVNDYELAQKGLTVETAAAGPQDPIKKEVFALPTPSRERVAPLSQELVDILRMRIIKVLVDNAQACAKRGLTPDLGLKHVWFPANDYNGRELRSGPPPVDSVRPKHLRGLRLEVDVFNWPPRIIDMLEARGVKAPGASDLEASLRAGSTAVEDWEAIT